MENLSLDIRTFMLSMGIFGLTTSFMVFSFSFRFPKSIQGLSAWSSGIMTVGFAFIFFLFRGILPWFLTHFLANVFILSGVFLMLLGLLRNRQIRSRIQNVFVAIYLLTFAVVCYDAYGIGDSVLPVRTTIFLLIANSFFLFSIAIIIFKNERNQVSISSALSTLSCTLLGIVVLRRAIRIFIGLEEQSIFSSSLSAQLVFYSIGGSCIIISNLGFILMAMERLNFEAMKQMTQNEHMDRLKSLGEMGAGVAHEINNPLAIIKFNLERLQNLLAGAQVENQKIKDVLDRSFYAIDRVSKIVRGLLVFAKEGSQDDFSKHSLSSIVEDSLMLCKERIKSKNIELQVSSCPDLELICHPMQISQVLLNLLNNAIDSIHDTKSEERKIWIDFAKDSRRLKIKVTNSGPTISPDLQNKIFQPFFTTKDVGQGTGLGLSISLGIAQRHDGALYLEKNSKLTCFVLELPLRAAA